MVIRNDKNSFEFLIATQILRVERSLSAQLKTTLQSYNMLV